MGNDPKIIKGGNFNDERGLIRFVNDFHFEDIKRFYLIKHPDTKYVRAWQGHQLESKYFYPVSGSFVVAWIKIDNFENPSKNLIPEHHQLSAKNSEIIYIPNGYANGLKALEEKSELLIFSDMLIANSVNDNKRYPSTFWFDWEHLKPLL